MKVRPLTLCLQSLHRYSFGASFLLFRLYTTNVLPTNFAVQSSGIKYSPTCNSILVNFIKITCFVCRRDEHHIGNDKVENHSIEGLNIRCPRVYLPLGYLLYNRLIRITFSEHVQRFQQILCLCHVSVLHFHFSITHNLMDCFAALLGVGLHDKPAERAPVGCLVGLL